MSMAIDSERALKKGQKTNTKETMSISIDSDLKGWLIEYCENHNLKYAPIVEDLIRQFKEEREGKPKKK